MKAMMIRFLREETGVTAIEYGLIAGLIAALIIGSVTSIGTKVEALFSQIASSLPSG
ncbi:Flp family type IVb pilin [Burkholderia sp. MR1-5-21]